MLSEKRKKWLEEFRQKQEDKKLKRKIKKERNSKKKGKNYQLSNL